MARANRSEWREKWDLTAGDGLELLEVRRLFAPLTWSAWPTLPEPRDHAAVVATGSTIYLLGGKTTGGAGSRGVLTQYSGSTAWSSLPSIDLARASAGAGLASNGLIIFGGKAGQVEDSSLRYDPSGNDSQDAATMNTPRWQLASAWDDSGIYAIGGLDDGNAVLKTVERYDGANDQWDFVASIPAGRFGATAVADGGGHLLVFGGATVNNAISVSNSVYLYDEADDSWSTLAPMPVAVRDAAAAVGPDGRIYVIGGATAAGATATVQSYDPTSDTWTIEPSLPMAIRNEAAAMDSDGRIEVIGGVDAAGNSLANVYVTQRLNEPDTLPVFTSTPVTRGSADSTFTYQVVASGNPLPTYSLVDPPAGMTINGDTGLINWQPAAAQVGSQAVVVRATNFAGSTDQSFTVNVVLETLPPTPVTNVHVSTVSTNSITLAWDAATDNVAVSGYKIYERRHTGFHGMHITYSLVGTSTTTEFTVSGLSGFSSHAYAVAAVDSSGNESPRSPAVTGTTYSKPSLSFYVGTPSGTALHPLAFSLYSYSNPKATYSLVSGPDGMMVDPVSGMVKWVPGVADIGSVPVIFRAMNIAGSTDLSASIVIRPDVPILSYSISPVLANQPMAIQLKDSSLTTSTYSIVTGPADMTIDPVSGLATWTPTPANAGSNSIVFNATNSAGSSNLTVNFYVPFTGAVSNIAASNITANSALISWSPPADASLVAGYRITVSYRARAIRGYTTRSYTYTSNSTATSFTVTGLSTNVTYTPRVIPLDAAGNTGNSASGTSFVPRVVVPLPPTPPPPPTAPMAPGDNTNGTTSSGSGTSGILLKSKPFSLTRVQRPLLERPEEG